MSIHLYQGLRSRKILSCLKDDSESVITSQTENNNKENFANSNKHNKSLKRKSTELYFATQKKTCEQSHYDFGICTNKLMYQNEIDKYEQALLEKQTTFRNEFKNVKSLSLTDLTVDNTILKTDMKHYRSASSFFTTDLNNIQDTRSSTLIAFFGTHEYSNRSDFTQKIGITSYRNEVVINTHIDAHSEDCNIRSSTQLAAQSICIKVVAHKKCLSLSDLTQDNQASYTLMKRAQSTPPDYDRVYFSSSNFTAPNEHNDVYCPSISDEDKLSTTDFYEDYGDMNEGRKRRHVARVDEWKKNQAQRKRMRGEEYLGYSKPKNEKMQQDTLRPAKEMGDTCTSQFCIKSKLRGCSTFDEETRKALHNYFWKKLNWDERKFYVKGLVTRSTTNRPTKGKEDSRRTGTFNYFLPKRNNEGKTQVCKQMFINTLSLKPTTVQIWAKGTEFDEHTENDNTNQLNSESSRVINARNLNIFLKSIPKLPSHYARYDSKKLYIEPVYRTITDVYKDYKQYCNKIEVRAVSRFTFDKAFDELNLGLCTLKKDMCDTCVGYKEGNIDDHEFQEHNIKKNRARQEKEDDKKKAANGEFILLTMDLESVKVCPYLTASALYFKTKLSCHNFTLFDLTTRHCTCYWFTETAADLTASTFASCIIDYLERHCLPKQKPIVIYSDGCTYQNRNAILANALIIFSIKNKVTVTQKFLEKGHTQMECDSVHSAIERKLTNREIYLPSGYVAACKEARLSDPYEVIEIDHNFVKNYANESTWLYKSIRPGRKAGDPTVTDIRAIEYNQDENIKVKLYLDQEWLALPQRPKKLDVSSIGYAPLNTQMIPIKASKYRHLQDLKAVLPRDCHDFYDSLPHS